LSSSSIGVVIPTTFLGFEVFNVVQYIKELAATIQLARQNLLGEGSQLVRRIEAPDIHSLLKGLAEEVDRLDPRDFDPKARHDFVVLRIAIRNSAKGQIGNGERAAANANEMSNLLDFYQGEGSGAFQRPFAFVTAVDVRQIVERDYRELTQRAFPDGAWKSSVILSGSILEAVLHDNLTKDVAAVAASMANAKAPRKKGGAVKDITVNDFENEWKLNDLIKVACDLRLLPYKDESAIHNVLREYRNLVHARAEIAMGIMIGEGHATASKGMLDVILDHLT
jgi:hypothetical protein